MDLSDIEEEEQQKFEYDTGFVDIRGYSIGGRLLLICKYRDGDRDVLYSKDRFREFGSLSSGHIISVRLKGMTFVAECAVEEHHGRQKEYNRKDVEVKMDEVDTEYESFEDWKKSEFIEDI